jgi:hypothetical protein
VLQRPAKLAEYAHALFNGLAAEHVNAQLQTALVKIFLVHRSFPFERSPLQRNAHGFVRRIPEP